MKYLCLGLIATVGLLSLEGAPYRYDNELTITVRELQDALSYLRREVNNQNESIQILEQKAVTQEDILESLQKESEKNRTLQKERLKVTQGDLESKTESLQKEVKALSDHSKETQEALKAYKSKLSSLEKNLEGIQGAMANLVELVRMNAGLPSNEGDLKVYKVKAGDSLEKIARIHGTTIKALKDTNGLTKDQIVIGQTLKLPE